MLNVECRLADNVGVRDPVVGFGIGRLAALAFASTWPVSRSSRSIASPWSTRRRRRGAADSGGDDLALAEGADLVVLAAPVRQNIAILEALAGAIRHAQPRH